MVRSLSGLAVISVSCRIIGAMKKADLEKMMASRVGGPSRTPDRFGKDSALPLDKREQRSRDRELGLVPFAVKLHGDLVREIHALAQSRGVGLNEITAELIKKGMAQKK
jgi:hypothetical protein